MSKKVKKVILGVKVAEKLVEGRNMEKICSMIREDKFDGEAIRYILDNSNSSQPFGAIFNKDSATNPYTFDVVYGSFENYVNSGLAKFLYREGDSGEYIRWFNVMPENSESLTELYNSSNEDVKKIIFKTLMYRKRSITLHNAAIKNYLNCFDAIVNIVKEQALFETNHELYQYIVKWSCVIDKNNLKKIEEVIGLEDTQQLIIDRIDLRYSYDKTESLGYEISELYSYLQDAGQELTYDLLLGVMNYGDWNVSTRQSGILFDYCKKAYRMFFADKIKDKIENMDARTISNISKRICFLIAYEDNEDKKNVLFQLGVKTRGYERFIEEICYYARYKEIEYKLTPEIVKLSKIFTRSFECLLLDKKIQNAEELISLKESWFPHASMIDDFNSNPFVYNNLRFEEFSEDDMQKISIYLNWEDCRGYFKGGVVPIDFLIKYGNKMSNNCIICSILYGKLTASEVAMLLERFQSRFSNNERTRIAYTVLSNRGGATAEEIATAIKLRNPSQFIDVDSIHEDHTASLQSILTLL